MTQTVLSPNVDSTSAPTPAQPARVRVRPGRTSVVAPALSLCWRELVRFLRQRNRVIGAFATPIVFWLLIGLGMGHSFQPPAATHAAVNGPAATHAAVNGPAATDAAANGSVSAVATAGGPAVATAGGPAVATAGGGVADGGVMGGGYINYFFPGTVLMILLFTAIFSTISVIEDRREGFLQSVLVAPVGRSAIVLGKVLGGTILATGQGMIFLLLAPTVGISLSPMMMLMSLAMMLLLSFGLTSLGLLIAWRMSSTQGFHAIMNLFLMPLWFLSGALFPVRDEMPRVLQYVMLANPLTYGLSALRTTILWGSNPATGALAAQIAIAVAATILVFGLTLAVATRSAAVDAV